jgi:hypothetical protein
MLTKTMPNGAGTGTPKASKKTTYGAPASTDIVIIESDSVIASMNRAHQALAEAVSVSQTKTIIDVAHAAEIYAKRQHLSESAINQATSVKVEAMRKLGEILRDTPKNQGAKGLPGGGTRGTKKEPRVDEAPTLDELGLSKKESAVAQKLASLSDEAFEQVRSGSVTIAKAVAVVAAEKAKPASREYLVNPDVEDVAFREAEPEDTGPDADELAAQEAAEQADRQTMQLLLDSDDKFATAVAEINRLKAEVFILKQSRNGYMNEVNAAKALVKKRDYQITKMSEEIAALKRGAA